jgi:hypothetical protein
MKLLSNLVLLASLFTTVTGNVCGQRMDIVLGIDRSGSIGQTNWNNLVLSLKNNFVPFFTISPTDVRIGINSFATSATVDLVLGSPNSVTSSGVINSINGITYNGGYTYTVKCLYDILTVQLPNRRLPDSNGVIGFTVFLITDGNPNPSSNIDPRDGSSKNQKTTAISIKNEIKASGSVTFICLGVGNDIDVSFMNTLCDYYENIADFSKLSDTIDSLISKQICTASPTTSSPTTRSPTEKPTEAPTTRSPTGVPTETPTTRSPTVKPTEAPTTRSPTVKPTETPTTRSPTVKPTETPTTRSPTVKPTETPTTRSPTG